MQAAQRKIEYRPSSAAPEKRIVKKDGNVAYIKTGSPGSATSRGAKAGSPGSAAPRGVKAGYHGRAVSPKGTIGVRHPVRVGGGSAAAPKKVRGGAAPKSSSVVRISTAAKQTVHKAAAAKQAKRVRTSVASTILVVFVTFCALSLMISRYAAVSALGSENNKLRKSINDIQTKIEQLKVDMELQDNIENVRNTAVNVLGMTYPDESQKVPINMS